MGRVALGILVLICAASGESRKIVVMNADERLMAELRAVSPKANLVAVTPATVMQEIGDAEGFIGSIRPEEVRAGKNLKWVQVMSAGVERVLHLAGSELRDSNIVLTNNQIVQGPAIADHAMALLLTLTRGMKQFTHQQRDGQWNRRGFAGIELAGRTAVVIGVGGIGTQIAVRAHAFGMEVIGVDPADIPITPFVKKAVKPDQLDEVLPLADVIFVSAPHTPATDKMIAQRQFELMKQGSYFIVVSRGALYDMDALVRALDTRRLAGAGVDVTVPEPLPQGHPLWQFENAIITPHVAGGSEGNHARMLETVKANLARFVDGKPLINVVDKGKGY